MNITVPGFRFAGVSCGIKRSKKRDLALIVSERPATAAAVFTTNRVKAAPVLTGMKRVRRGKIQAVVVNSGNANACTGKQGMRDAENMCRLVGARLGIDPNRVVPSSTGVIGVPLPMQKVIRGVGKAADVLSPDSFSLAATAILTTDRVPKTSMTACRLDGKKVVVAGMAKGAGMVAPRMATVLGYILTDAAVDPACLRDILSRTADRTFNAVTVDGDTSTNDTILFLANGVAGNRAVRKGGKDAKKLEKAVSKVMKDLALMLVADAEGGTKVAEILVEGARSPAEAKKVASAVANSNLVKTAFFGEDPNLGRIMAAVGYADVPLDPDKIDVSLGGVRVVRRGMALRETQSQAARIMRQRSYQVRINLRRGKQTASVWTSDLSTGYVRINSAYRT